MRRWRAVVVLVAAALLCVMVGCASRKEPAYAPRADSAQSADYGRGYRTDGRDVILAAPPEKRASAPARRSRSGSSYGSPAEPAAVAEPEPSPEASSEAPAESSSARMVFYDGWMRLRVTRPEALIEEVIAEVEKAGGSVEQRTQSRVTARVPVAVFRDTFESVLAMGDVLDRSLSAQDITDAYEAVDLRVQAAQATLKRLQELLAEATEERDKLELLAQIRRLTEQLDVMEAQRRTLATLAAYSRLTVEAVPREAFTARRDRQELVGPTSQHPAETARAPG